MKVQNIDKWNLFSYDKLIHHEELQRVSNHLKMNASTGDAVKVSFSKEGLDALHGQKLQGSVDVEEMKKMEEILPKLSYNPSDELLWAMREDATQALNIIKEQKGSYTLDDMLSIRMEAYANQYEALQKAYADGTREVYVCDGFDENGKFQYHKLTLEEELDCLDEAFERIEKMMIGSLSAKENLIHFKEIFGGEKINLEFPEDYEENMQDILEQTVLKYKELKNNGEKVNITQLVQQFFNKDKEFADIMRKLYTVS